MFVRRNRLTAWIAIVAVLLSALAPGLARALSAPQKVMPWGEICTAVATPAAPGALTESGAERHHDKIFKHCPFCLNHAGHFALPATPPGFPPAADPGTKVPDFLATPSSVRATRVSPPPRAPPANS